MSWERVVEGTADRGPLVGTAYRPIRRVSAAEAPVAGELAVAGDETVLLVDAGELRGWDGWAHGGSQHVVGVRDIARRANGHDAVLPACGAPLEAAVASAPEPLSGGEAVTLAVSLLRGVDEARGAAAGGAEPRGRWWLLADGRPALVPRTRNDDGEECGAAAVRILAAVAAQAPDRVVRRLLEDACAVLEAGAAVPGGLEGLEDRLFEACAPRPLDRLLAGAGAGVEAGPRAVAVALPGRGQRTRRELRRAREPHRLWRRRTHRDGRAPALPPLDPREIIDAALSGRIAESLSAHWAALRRRASALRGRRSGPLLLGAAVAAGVIAVGATWPPGDQPASAEPAPAATDAGGGSAAPDPEPGAGAAGAAPEAAGDPAGEAPEEPDPAREAPEAAAARLLDGLAVCAAAGDAACAAVRAPGAAPLELADDAAARLPAGERAIELLDDFGGVVVLRVAPADPDSGVAAQSVVIERGPGGGRWVLRDVHDLSPHTPEGPG